MTLEKPIKLKFLKNPSQELRKKNFLPNSFTLRLPLYQSPKPQDLWKKV